MKYLFLVVALTLPAPAFSQAPAASTPVGAVQFSVQTSTIGALLENSQAKAIFEKHLPEIANHPQISEGLQFTLPDIVQFMPEVVTPAKLTAMEAELKALPAK